MKTMLDIVKERLPEGIEIASVKEDRSKYEVTLTDGEYSSKCWVNKTYAPNMYERAADSAIYNAMAGIAIDRGDIATGKAFLAKIAELGKDYGDEA